MKKKAITKIILTSCLISSSSFGIYQAGNSAISALEKKAEDVKQSLAYSWGFALPEKDRTLYEISDTYAELNGLNKCLMRALIKTESDDGRLLASPAGALGVMQVMPQSAKDICKTVDYARLVKDDEFNIWCGQKIYMSKINSFGKTWATRRYNGWDDSKENTEFAHKVIGNLIHCKG